jgi:sugar lactone lactonase YvrE
MALDEARTFANAQLPTTPGSEMRFVDGLILSSDFPSAIGRDRALYFALLGGDGRLRLMRFLPTGAMTPFATLPGGIQWINGIAAAPDGSLYYTESRAVRRVDAKGVLTTIAEAVMAADCARIPTDDPQPLPYLRGLAVAPSGDLFVAASGCGAVLKITPRGEVTTILRTESPWSPTAVAVSGKTVYVLEYLHTASDNRREWLPRVRKISSDGRTAVIAAIERR